MGKRKAATGRGIRLLHDAIIDEAGAQWDQVLPGTGYLLTPEETAVLIPKTTRFLRTSAYGTPAVDVSEDEFTQVAAVSPDHRVQAFASDGSVLLLVDDSDC